MKKLEKSQKITFSRTEKNLLSELVEIAPAVLLSLQRLIKAGNGEMYFKDFPKINLLIFLLTEFSRRSVLAQENGSTKIDNPEKDL